MLPEDSQNQNGPASASHDPSEPSHAAASAPEERLVAAEAVAGASPHSDDNEDRRESDEKIQPSDIREAPVVIAGGTASSPSPTPPQEEEGEEGGAAGLEPITPAPEGVSPDDPSTFQDLLADTNSTAAVLEELLQLRTTSSFTGFDSDDGLQPTPAFRLALHSIDLIRALQLLEACTPKSQKLGPIRISITANEIKVQAFPDAFFELRIEPISVHGLSGQDRAVLFIQGDDFRRTCAALDDDVELRHVPVLNVLHVRSGNFERPVVLADPSIFTPLNQKNIGQIDPANKRTVPRTLSPAVKYVSPHVVANPLQPSFSVIDCNNGMVVGGTRSVIARFAAPDLHEIDLCFDHRYVDFLLLILDGVEETSLYETDYFSIICTSYLSIGIPKSPARSPIVNLKIGPDPTHLCLFPRTSLSDSLGRVEHALGLTSVRIRAKSAGHLKAELTAAGKDGASIRDTIDVNSTYEKFDLRVESEFLSAAIAKERSANVVFHLRPDALILNDSDGKIEAITAIAQSVKKSNHKSLAPDHADESDATQEP
jgi:hypothetical protein